MANDGSSFKSSNIQKENYSTSPKKSNDGSTFKSLKQNIPEERIHGGGGRTFAQSTPISVESNTSLPVKIQDNFAQKATLESKISELNKLMKDTDDKLRRIGYTEEQRREMQNQYTSYNNEYSNLKKELDALVPKKSDIKIPVAASPRYEIKNAVPQTIGSKVANFFKTTVPNATEDMWDDIKEPITGPSLKKVMTEAKISPQMLVDDAKVQMQKENPTREDYALVRQTQEAIKKYGQPNSNVKAITEDTTELQKQLDSAEKTWQVSPVDATTANIAAAGSNMFGDAAGFTNMLGADKVPIIKDINNAIISTAEVLGENAQDYNRGSYGEALGSFTQGVTSLVPYMLIGTGKAVAKGGKAAQLAYNTVVNPSFWYSLTSMSGNKYRNNINNGISRGKATLNALLYALPSAMVEVGGGIGAQGKEAQSIIKTVLEEVMEEETQNIIEGVVDKVTTQPDMKIFSNTEKAIINPNEMVKTALYTAPVAAVGGGANRITNNIIENQQAQAQINQDIKNYKMNSELSKYIPGIYSKENLSEINSKNVVFPKSNVSESSTTDSKARGNEVTPLEDIDRLLGNNKNKLSEPGNITQLSGKNLNADSKMLNEVMEISNKIGRPIEFFEAKPEINGYIKDGKFYLNKNSQNSFRDTYVHELTHYIEQSKDYTKMANEIFNSELFNEMLTSKNMSVTEYIDSIKQTYAENGIQLDENSANLEVIAKFAEEKLFKSQEDINRLAQTNPTVFERVKQFIDDLVIKFTGTSNEKEIRNIQNMYKKALQEANNMKVVKGTKYSFAGTNAKNSDVKKLNFAEQLEKNGTSAEEIYKQTGWYRGNEGKWRFEIDDSKFNINQKPITMYSSYNLSEILNADSLYEAYPELKNIEIYFGDMGENTNGAFNPTDKSITINSNLIEKNTDPRTQEYLGIKNQSKIFSTLMHEIQHYIQNIEGFTPGANGDQIYRDTIQKAKEYAESLPAFQELQSAKEKAQFVDDFIKMSTDEYAIKSKYKNQGGEQEARNVQERIKLSSEVKKQTMPFVKNEDTLYVSSPNRQQSIAGIKARDNINDSEINSAYDKAVLMSKNNVDNETIRQKTGWFQDINGDWKFEFSDKDMKLKEDIKLSGDGMYKLGDILEHSALFSAYPELADYSVKIEDLGKKKGGAFARSSNTIKLNENLNSKLDVEGTLIHEIQHAIQKIEGFEGGASSRLSRLAYYKSLGEIEASNTKDRFLEDKSGKFNRNSIAPESSKENPKHKGIDNYLKNRKTVDKVKDGIYNYFSRGGNNYEVFEEDNIKNNRQNRNLVDSRGLQRYVEADEQSAFSMQKNKEELKYQGDNLGSGKPKETGINVSDSFNKIEERLNKYRNIYDESMKEALNQVEKAKNNPDSDIKIYRASPSNKINNGDWVYLSKEQAERWTKTHFGTPKPNYSVTEMTVKAKDVEWSGKNLDFVYSPKLHEEADKASFSISQRKDDANRITYYNYPNGDKVEIIKNPTDNEYSQLAAEEKKSWGINYIPDEPLIRSTYDSNGNQYVWRASEAMHDTVESYLSTKTGLKFNQNKSMVKNTISTDSLGAELSDNQKEFFSESKVVNYRNELVRLYHGTNSNFNVFKLNTMHTRTGNTNKYGTGIYLTSSKNLAGDYGEINMEVYANIKTPFVLEHENAHQRLYQAVNEKLGTNFDNIEDANKYLREQNYDGIIRRMGKNMLDIVVAFEPNQIKNVENLNPTSNPDIRYSIETMSKSEQYQKKQENLFLKKVSDSLGISKFSNRKSLKSYITQISSQIKEGKPINKDSLFEKIFNEGIKVNDSYYNEYKPLKKSIRNTRVYVPENVMSDIADYNDFRKSNMGTLTLVSDSSALPIDSLYQELNSEYGELFPDNLINPSDQLMRISEVAKSIVKSEEEISRYAENNKGYKEWARNEFDKAYNDFMVEINQVSKVESEKRSAKEKEQSDKEMTKNVSVDDLKEAYKAIAVMRKEAEKITSKELPTKKDKITLDRLIKGEISFEEIPKDSNTQLIKKLYEVKKPVADMDNIIKTYNATRKLLLREEAGNVIANSNDWKEKKTGIQYARETMERNFRDIAGEDAELLNKTYSEPIHINEAESTRLKNKYREKVQSLNLSDKDLYNVSYIGEFQSGRNPNLTEEPVAKMVSERALVQLYGEKKIDKTTLESLGADVEKIENAVNTFRSIYNELIEKASDVLIKNGYAPVEYRKDYFPHFVEEKSDGILSKIGSALGIDVNSKELPTDIAGLTHTFKPGKKWVGNFLKRKGEVTDFDAIKGFDRYVESVADVIYHTEDIQKLRALEDEIRYKYSDDGTKEQIDKIRENDDIAPEDKRNRIEEIYQTNKNEFPHLVTWLRSYTDSLAGKKSIEDRIAEQQLGRAVYDVSKSLENRVSANMIALNVNSWLTNFIPLAQASGTIKGNHLLHAMKDTIKGYAKSDELWDRSTFLTNRKGSDTLTKTPIEKLSSKLDGMSVIDDFTSETLVRARYYQNMANGMNQQEALREADINTAKIMADRSKGALPTVFNTKNPISKLISMFQVEMNNQWSYYLKDVPDELKKEGAKAIAFALARIFIASWLYNEAKEKITGSRSATDPIDILVKGAKATQSDGILKGVGSTAIDILEEVPFIGGVLGGGRIPISSALPDVVSLAKGETKLEKELIKPATYLLPPFGGGQLKKAIEGVSTFAKGGSYGKDNQGREILKYPVEKDIGNAIKSVLFGKYSTSHANEYINNGFKPLSAKQTEGYKEAKEQGIPYDKYIEAYNAQKDIEGSKNSEGKTIPLSASENKKKAIDELIPGYTIKQKETLYEAFGISEKVWKDAYKK